MRLRLDHPRCLESVEAMLRLNCLMQTRPASTRVPWLTVCLSACLPTCLPACLRCTVTSTVTITMHTYHRGYRLFNWSSNASPTRHRLILMAIEGSAELAARRRLLGWVGREHVQVAVALVRLWTRTSNVSLVRSLFDNCKFRRLVLKEACVAFLSH